MRILSSRAALVLKRRQSVGCLLLRRGSVVSMLGHRKSSSLFLLGVEIRCIVAQVYISIRTVRHEDYMMSARMVVSVMRLVVWVSLLAVASTVVGIVHAILLSSWIRHDRSLLPYTSSNCAIP